MRVFDILKQICDEHNLKIIDCNEYNQPKFKERFDKLIQGRTVAVAFVSNKFNKKLRERGR